MRIICEGVDIDINVVEGGVIDGFLEIVEVSDEFFVRGVHGGLRGFFEIREASAFFDAHISEGLHDFMLIVFELGELSLDREHGFDEGLDVSHRTSFHENG